MNAAEASAPARVLLARGVAVALDRRATCRVERVASGVFLESRESLARAQAAHVRELNPPAALRPFARLLASLGLEEGVRVSGHGRVPPDTGLATDVALTVAAAAAALRLLGHAPSHDAIARVACDALRDDDAGPQAFDVDVSLRGGIVASGHDGAVTRLPADPGRVEEALLLADVGLPARAAPRDDAWTDDECAVRDALAAALLARDDARVPALVTRGWEVACRACPGCATPEADAVLSLAREAGGAGRPCGAGGGGLVVLWLPVDARAGAQERLRAAGVRTYPARVDLLGLEVEAG